jgi:DNA adenine methylase
MLEPSMGIDDSPRTNPFLKWAGGKSRLLPELLRRIPTKFGRYFEPFLGGGALFFSAEPKDAVLSDLNAELTTTYRAVQSNVEDVIRELSLHAEAHATIGTEYYYNVRNEDWTEFPSKIAVAARMIYLNRACFNGLYRMNKSGKFNVSIGTPRSTSSICAPGSLRACSRMLQGIAIENAGYEIAVAAISGDFVYFDPPYIPSSPTAKFTSYTAGGFGQADQLQLAHIAGWLKKHGVYVLVSNSYSDATAEMYRSAGLTVEQINAPRSMAHNAAKSTATEILAY